jgi:hypothetical protein
MGAVQSKVSMGPTARATPNGCDDDLRPSLVHPSIPNQDEMSKLRWHHHGCNVGEVAEGGSLGGRMFRYFGNDAKDVAKEATAYLQVTVAQRNGSCNHLLPINGWWDKDKRFYYVLFPPHEQIVELELREKKRLTKREEQEVRVVVLQLLEGFILLEQLQAECGFCNTVLNEETFVFVSGGCAAVRPSLQCIEKKAIMQNSVGYPWFIAPEVLSATGFDRRAHSWALGCLMYTCLCGFPPFYGETVPELFERILEFDYDIPEDVPEGDNLSSWKNISFAAKDLISKVIHR